MTATGERVGRAAGWLMASRVIRFGLGIATSAVVVRGLGGVEYSHLSVARTVAMIAVLLSGAGASKSLLKFLPLTRDRGGKPASRRLLCTVGLGALLLWLVAFAVVYRGRFVLENVLGVPAVVLAVAVGLAGFELLFTIASQVYYAGLDARRQAIAAVASHLVYFAGVLYVFRTDGGLVGILATAACGFAVGVLVLAPGLGNALGRDLPGGECDVPASRVLRYAAPITAIAVLNMVVWRQSEMLFLSHYSGGSVPGYFDVAYRLPQMILEFVPGTLWPLVMAGLATVHARDAGALADAVGKYYRMLFLVVAPLCAGGMTFGGAVIVTIYSEKMAPAALPAQAFFGIFTLSFLANPLSMALLVVEKPSANLLVYGVLAVVNVGLDLLLIPRFGLWGAVIPVAVVMTISPFAYAVALRKLHIRVSMPGRFIARCFLASAPVGLLYPLVGVSHSPIALGLLMALALPILLVSFRYFRVVGPGEREMLASLPIPAMSWFLKFVSPRTSVGG